MKRISIILLIITFTIVLHSNADTIAMLFPTDISCASQVHLSDTIKSSIDVTLVDNTQDEWSWYKIISLLVAVIVPLSSVWLAWKLNRDNNDYNLTKQKQELQCKHDEDLKEKKIQKQGDVLTALNTLDSRCRTKETITKEDVKKVSDQVLMAYPYIGKDLYLKANQIIEIIERYITEANNSAKAYTTEDDKLIKEGIADFLKKYNANVNS